MSDGSGMYDPRESGETVTMENVSLMPNWLGFNAVWALILVVVCILLLFPSVAVFYVLPWQFGVAALLATIAFDVGLLFAALIAAILTPSHEGTWKYITCRWGDFRGRDTIRSDPALPSTRGRGRGRGRDR